MRREFDVLIERDSEGYYVATVPALRGCHTQARSLDQSDGPGSRSDSALPGSRGRRRSAVGFRRRSTRGRRLMTKLPRPSGKDLVAALGKLGFAVVRIRGGHHYLRHPDGRARSCRCTRVKPSDRA